MFEGATGARWNAIRFGAARRGLAGTLFGLVPPGGAWLERYLVWYRPLGAGIAVRNGIAFQTGQITWYETQ